MPEAHDFFVRGEDELPPPGWYEQREPPALPADSPMFFIEPEPPRFQLAEADKQNAEFTEIVQAFKAYYQKKSSSNHGYKLIFFVLVIGILLVITGGAAAACMYLLLHPTSWQTTAAVAAGSAVTLITALLKLPEIIATHLFPVEEDRVIVDLVNVLKDAPSFSSTFSEEKVAKRL